jgi:hypothetical protein
MVTSDRCQHNGKAYDTMPLVFQKDPKMSNQLHCTVVGMALVAMTLVVKPAAAQTSGTPDNRSESMFGSGAITSR